MQNRNHLIKAVLVAAAITLSACASGTNTTQITDTEPTVGQIRDICELAVLRCRYHNLAKSVKAPGEGILHLGEKSRKFWIEYQGTVEISYDVSGLAVDQNGTDIEITLPEPTLTCAVVPDSWNPDSYVIEPDQWIQKNPITADDQDKAIASAQKEMEEQVRNSSTLLATAQRQAQELIENYIEQIGNLTGTQYSVTWKTEESGAESTENENSSS